MNTTDKPAFEPVCSACNGKGYHISTRSADMRKAVERCDTCFAFPDDVAASYAATADGIKCQHVYPCYIIKP